MLSTLKLMLLLEGGLPLDTPRPCFDPTSSEKKLPTIINHPIKELGAAMIMTARAGA